MPESALRITTSSLQYFLPGILVGFANFPDGLITSPGANRGADEFNVNTDDIESLRLVMDMESLRSTYNEKQFQEDGLKNFTFIFSVIYKRLESILL